MSQVSGFGLPSAAEFPATPTPPVGQDARELTRKVAIAVHELNRVNFAGEGREITFTVDRTTHLPVISVLDTQSREVIRQWPTEYVLQVARNENSTTR